MVANSNFGKILCFALLIMFLHAACECQTNNSENNINIQDTINYRAKAIYDNTFKVDSISDEVAKRKYIEMLDSLNLHLLQKDSTHNLIWESQIRLDAYMNRNYQERLNRIEQRIKVIDYDLGGKYGLLEFMKDHNDTANLSQRVLQLNREFKDILIRYPDSSDASMIYALFLNDFYSKEKSLNYMDSIIELYPSINLKYLRENINEDSN